MTTRFARHAELRLTVIGNEGIALHLGTRRYYTVSESGVTILETLAAPSTMDEVVGRLTEVFDVAPAEAEKAARAFLEQGQRAGLVTVEDVS